MVGAEGGAGAAEIMRWSVSCEHSWFNDCGTQLTS